MQNIPKKYIPAPARSIPNAGDERPKIEPTPLSPAQYTVLSRMSLYISPFNFPYDFLTHFSMHPYKGRSAVLTLRHFVPKQPITGFAFDANLVVLKWFVNATEMSPFQDQTMYLARVKASSNPQNYAYFLTAFKMGFILANEIAAPSIKFIQPSAINRLTDEELEEEMKAQLALEGIDPEALQNIISPLAIESAPETPTPKQTAETPILPKTSQILAEKKKNTTTVAKTSVTKKITKEPKEKKFATKKNAQGVKEVVVDDSVEEEMVEEKA